MKFNNFKILLSQDKFMLFVTLTPLFVSNVFKMYVYCSSLLQISNFEKVDEVQCFNYTDEQYACILKTLATKSGVKVTKSINLS